MEAIRLHLKIDSETLHIPELKRFHGKNVELILIEESTSPKKKNGKMDHFFAAAKKVEINEDAINKLRERSKI